MKEIAIVLADDQQLFAEGLKTVLENDADEIKVIGIANNGIEALRLVQQRKPDVVLMDVRMPVLDGVEATRRLRQKYPDLKIVMLTTFDDDEYVGKALQYGAMGYLLKTIAPLELIASIRAIQKGAVLMDPAIAKKLVEKAFNIDDKSVLGVSRHSESMRNLFTLSKRETEILRLIAKGLGNKQICEQLCIADSTVRNHVTTIYSKLAVHDRYEAMQIAIQGGIV